MAGLILSRSAVNEALQGRQPGCDERAERRVARWRPRDERGKEERREEDRIDGSVEGERVVEGVEGGGARAEAARGRGVAQNETCNKVSF